MPVESDNVDEASKSVLADWVEAVDLCDGSTRVENAGSLETRVVEDASSAVSDSKSSELWSADASEEVVRLKPSEVDRTLLVGSFEATILLDDIVSGWMTELDSEEAEDGRLPSATVEVVTKSVAVVVASTDKGIELAVDVFTDPVEIPTDVFMLLVYVSVNGSLPDGTETSSMKYRLLPSP